MTTAMGVFTAAHTQPVPVSNEGKTMTERESNMILIWAADLGRYAVFLHLDLASTLRTALGKVSSAAKISSRTVVVARATLDQAPVDM